MGSKKKSNTMRDVVTQALMHNTHRGNVDKQGLANHLDVSLSTIDRWIKLGMPYLERGGFGKPWKFNITAVRLWKMRNKK